MKYPELHVERIPDDKYPDLARYIVVGLYPSTGQRAVYAETDNDPEMANLIAAAPLLLQYLKQAVKRVEIANGEGDPILSAWMVYAKRAIDKANGEVLEGGA